MPAERTPGDRRAWLHDRLAAHGARPAVVDAEGQRSSAGVLDRSDALAGALLAGRASLGRERVILLAGAGHSYVEGLLAIWRGGGVAVPLAPNQPEAEWAFVARDCEAGLAVVDPEFADRFAPVAAAHRLRIVRTDEPGRPAGASPSWSGPALILYTSGTTSRPKGVVLTHENLEFQVQCLTAAWGWRHDDRILHVLPLNHVHGIVNVLLCALWNGAVCEMLPRFDAGRVWSRMAEGGATVFMAVPTVYARLIAAWDEASDETRRAWASGARAMRLMVSGSAALPVTVLERWERMTGHTLLERYGMTEVGMALSNPLEGLRRPGTVGQPLPGVDVRLLDEAGVATPPGQPGEIHVRSAGVFESYWKRPAETAAAFREGRWFRTGDVGAVDDGYYRILGRLSVDIIKTGGEKVSALEIEEALRGHPGVEDCAIVGVAHPDWGEQVSAAVVAKGGQRPTLADLRAWAGSRLARHKLPGRLVLVEALPRNALGKVVKAEVKGLFPPESDPGSRSRNR